MALCLPSYLYPLCIWKKLSLFARRIQAYSCTLSHSMFPLEPICSWPMFKYVNERCCWCPINVIIFDIQHLRVWCSFSASDGTWWPKIFEQHDIWSIKKDQPSIPSMGRDLILGAAAAGSSRPMAIKLGMILKMLGMNKTWRFQRGGRFREMGSGES